MAKMVLLRYLQEYSKENPGTISIILVLDYVMRVAIGNDEELLGFTVTPSRRHPAKVITNLDLSLRYIPTNNFTFPERFNNVSLWL